MIPMTLEQADQHTNLLETGQLAMVVAPDVLGQIERQSLATDTAFGGQPALEVAPEAFQAIDVPFAMAVGTRTVPHQPVDVALQGDAGIAGEGIGPDGRARADSSTDQRPQRRPTHVGDDLRPDLAAAAENPEDGGLEGRAPALWAGATRRPVAAIAPPTAHVGLVDLHRASKDGRQFALHACPQRGQRPQDSLAMQPRLLRDRLRTEALGMASQQRPPLMPRQTQGQARRS